MIRIRLVEDHRPTRETLLKMLRSAPDIVCIGAHESAEEAEREIASSAPDVVLMDINLPGRSGIESVARIKRTHPALECIMLTTYEDTELIFEALRAGASGYLLKRSARQELIPAIRDVQRGGAPMSIKIARRVVTHFHQIRKPANEMETLTKRESEILESLAGGLSDKEIAEQLGVSRHTVNTHLRHIYEKLHVQTRTEAVVRFLKR
jgi:DNA-binding NarL/FixJ family response regulator